MMVGGKNKNKVRSAQVTPEQNQEVDFEEEGKIDKVSKHTQHPPGSPVHLEDSTIVTKTDVGKCCLL